MGKGNKSKKTHRGETSKTTIDQLTIDESNVNQSNGESTNDQPVIGDQAIANRPENDEQEANQSTGDQSTANRTVVDRLISELHDMDNSMQARASLNTTICESCKTAKGGAWVVQCDDCNKWFHFNCVEFNREEVGDDDPWSCEECNNKKVVIDVNSQANQPHRMSVWPINSNQLELTSQGNASEIIGTVVKSTAQSQSQSRRSYIEELDRTMVNSFLQWKSMQGQTLPNPAVRFSDTQIGLAISSSRNQANPRRMSSNQQRTSSLSEPNQAASSTVDRESQKITKVQQTEDNEMQVRQSVDKSCGESQKVPPKTKSTLYSHSNQPAKDNTMTLVQSEFTNRQPNQEKTRSISSKTTASSQSHFRLEQQRLQEELNLQAKLDEERIALKLEALTLKENREKKFLEDKFKAMNEEDNDNEFSDDEGSKTSKNSKYSLSSKHLNNTRHVLTWIEEQRKQKSKETQMEVDDSSDQQHFEYSIDMSQREVRKIKEKQRRSNEIEMEGPLEQSMQLNQNVSTFIRSKPTTNSGNAELSFQSQRVTIPLGSQNNNQAVLQANQQPAAARLNSTWIPTNMESASQLEQNGHQTHQQQSGVPSYSQGQCPVHSQSQNGPSSHQHIPNAVNPQIISSQQNMPPSIPQNSGYQHSQQHQSFPMSSQQIPQAQFQGHLQQNSQQHQSFPMSNQQIPQAQSQGYQQNVQTIPVWAVPQMDSQASTSSYQFGSQRPPLTVNQIAARHVVTRKLPFFYGNPGDWPEFIQKYKNTTTACGFDNTENLDRLSECLKGKAKDIVKSQLLMPDCVPSILDTLEQKYGRKEIVVKAVLKEIREEPPIKADKLEALSNFGYRVQNVCHTIQRQQMHFYMYNPELVQELVDKLPHQTKIDWARYSDTIPQVTLETLSDWLIKLSRSLNRITMPEMPTYSNDRRYDKRSDSSKGTYLNAHGNGKSQNAVQSSSKCECCSRVCKSLEECSKFKGISVDEKWKFMYDHKKVCRGCLKPHARKCTKARDCGINGCTFKHHPMLHNNEKFLKNKLPTQTSAEKEKEKSPSQTNPSCNAHRSSQPVLYKIIPVKLSYGNKEISTYAYMDDGSGLTLLESELAEELGLKGTPEKLCLRWTSGTVRHENDSKRVILDISGKDEGQHNYRMKDVRTVKSLDLPMQKIDKELLIKQYSYLERIPFKDFDATPRILIGLDNVKLGLSRDYIEGGWSEPIASKALLGWVVHGPNGQPTQGEGQHMQHHVMSINQCSCQSEKDEQLHKQIEEFFSLENFGTRALTSSVESEDTQRALRIMEKTTVRRNNRFETGLLWKFDNIQLPNNFPMAMKRLECQDRRMKSNPPLMENINNQIQNFIAKGYARKLTPEEIHVDHPRIWYLPVFHHLDPKKPEKVRLVWDAAAKYKGISLNSMLMTGPDNLVALIDILRRFREKRIAIGGDLEEMYHQVEVSKDDRYSQRFLWRDGNMEAVPDVYVMDVLTFGTNCSPSLAQNVKNKNASEFEKKYPQAAIAIKENHYVDDWLDSQHTVEEMIQLAKDVKYVHKQGGFNLRKFISNSADVLKALGDNNDQSAKDLNVNTTLATQRVLGMWWDAQADCFTYSLKYTKLNEEVLLGLRAPTKREVLQTLMSIYDPLGLIAFFLVYLKMLLQEIWKAKMAWDEQLPEHLNAKWKRWIKTLPSVETIRIPRLYSNKISPGTAKSIELHTFVDASEFAYCAMSYLRIIDGNGIECVLVGAKTKVAPIKPLLTIPRLELLAAVLGTRLATSIKESLTLVINKRYFWSDSRDVLCWIRSKTRKYRQFVAFRVGEILETSTETEWRWVPGKLNVADDGTKWSKLPRFDQDCRWFHAPEYIWNKESSWPEDLSLAETTEEEIHVHLAITKPDPPSQIVPEDFSSWSRLVNAQALSTRYLRKLISKVRGESLSGPLTSEEFKEAEYKLYRLAQFDCFYEEIRTLRNSKEEFGPKAYVNKSSSIYKCSPYLEENGLLRVRGRIDNVGGQVKFDTKRPIIMPKAHKITELLVDNFHRIYLHRNNETVINELRQKFHIPQIRRVLRDVISKCQICKNNRAKPIVPVMGDLPKGRLSPGFRAFTHTGVDYFGPMYVVVKRGTEKRWGVLFTCLTVRAIHLEIARDLTADSCILCVRNFINLRGTPAEFYSDNGSNMTAADKELKKEFEKLDQDAIQSEFTKSYSKWNFIPPASPHMGGSWERLIGVVKENLKVVMPTRTPKEDLLRSYLLEVANIINSRPLTYLAIESSEDEALTPNHFILGSSNGHKAPGNFPYEEVSLTKSWRRSQELTNMFWKRWIKEYLPTLTCRSKWFPTAKPVEVGDVVLLVDEKNARNCYPRGIVLEVLPDKYGQVRRATIRLTEVKPDNNGKTTDAPVRVSVKTRPVAKLAVLDVVAKDNKVKPVGVPTTRCLTEGENVTDGNNVIDNAKAPNPVAGEKKGSVRSDNRKPLIVRRSKRILDQKRN